MSDNYKVIVLPEYPQYTFKVPLGNVPDSPNWLIWAMDDRIKILEEKLGIAIKALENEYDQHEHINSKYAQGAAKIASGALNEIHKIDGKYIRT